MPGHHRLGAHRYAGAQVGVGQVQAEMAGQAAQVLQRLTPEILVAQHQGLLWIAGRDIAPAVEEARVPPGVADIGLAPRISGHIAAERRGVLGPPFLVVGDQHVAHVAHHHRIGRRPAQGPEPLPVQRIRRDGVGGGDARQVRMDPLVLGMADQLVGGRVVEVARRLDPVAMGDGVAQHPLDPVGAGVLPRDQEALEVVVLEYG